MAQKQCRKVSEGKNIFKLDKLLIPINKGNMTWMLAMVCIKQVTIKFYHSYTENDTNEYTIDYERPNRQTDQKYLDLIENYMKDEYKKKHHELEGDWSNRHMLEALENEPIQYNKDDSGIIVCATAEHILNGAP